MTASAAPSYWTLPRKGQILLLVLCRLTEPLAVTSIAPYLYFMVRDLGYDDPATISQKVTLIVASYPLGGALSAFLWGRFSDTLGRKPALMLGLLGTAFCTLLFGFASSVHWAMTARFLAGMLNGNGPVMKTVIAEIIGPRKEFQSRAFAILPMTFNIGAIIGPIIGGMLADPIHNHPAWFGGSGIFAKYPYALPNLVLLPLLSAAFVAAFLFVEETGTSPATLLPVHLDPGLRIGDKICSALGIAVPARLPKTKPIISSTTTTSSTTKPKSSAVPIKSMFTRPVLITIMCYVVLMLHCPSFMQMLPLFLSTPRMPREPAGSSVIPAAITQAVSDWSWLNFFRFNGGLGWNSAQIGSLMSVLGAMGIFLQLTVYPTVASIFGNAGIHKLSLLIFPIAYAGMPFLALVPDNGLSMALAVPWSTGIVLARTFALPPMTILLTNAAPSRSVLGQIHGLSSSLVSVSRCVGPFVLGNLYSVGVRYGIVGLAWWVMAGVVVVEIFVTTYLKEWGVEDGLKWEEEQQESDTGEREPLVREGQEGYQAVDRV